VKTSWVIAVEDLLAKDKAFKTIHKTRKEVDKKVSDLTERYESIEAERFSVFVVAPNGEVDPTQRLKLKFDKPKDGGLKLLFAYLHEFNPFCYAQTEQHAWIEIDQLENYQEELSHILSRE
jgi:hypothetical protein